MKILDFDLEGNHFIIEADVSPRQKADDMWCRWLQYNFENAQVYKEADGVISPFQITAVTWAGYQLTADHALEDVLERISRNETGKLTIHYVCPELQEFLDEFKKYPAIDSERIVPYFIFHRGDIARLAYATNRFLYYADSNDMPVMFRTNDGTLVADNEFADIGFYDSEQRVEDGTEYILPFTEYDSDAFLPESMDWSIKNDSAEQNHTACGYPFLIGYAPVEGGLHEQFCLASDPVNIASFIMKMGRERGDLMICTPLDTPFLNTFGTFIDRCEDQDFLQKHLLPVLVPMQMGKTEPQEIKLIENQDNEAFLDDFEAEDDMEL